MNQLVIHYFSGTGNTYHMAQTLGNRFAEQGVAVTYYDMQSQPNHTVADFHIFCFPIYGYGVPSLILRYFKQLQPVSNTKAAVFCTCGAEEGIALLQASSLLQKKGFDVVFTERAIYPDNWTQFSNPMTTENQAKALNNCYEQISQYASEMLQGKTNIRKKDWFTKTWSWLIYVPFSSFGRRLLGKSFIADDSCISCNKCEKTCPVQAIHMVKGKPKWNWACENCQRCMNVCPRQSIQTSLFRLFAFLFSFVLPILLLLLINAFYPLHIALDILFFILLNIGSILLLDVIISAMEQIPFFKKLVQWNVTKKHRRYWVKGYSAKLKA